jgi:hypothetical protein
MAGFAVPIVTTIASATIAVTCVVLGAVSYGSYRLYHYLGSDGENHEKKHDEKKVEPSPPVACTPISLCPEKILMDCWISGALSYSQAVQKAKKLLGDNFIEAYTSVPRIRTRGPLKFASWKALSDHIMQTCKPKQAAEWLNGFLYLYIDKTGVHTHTACKLNFEKDGVSVKSALFLVELVTLPGVEAVNAEEPEDVVLLVEDSEISNEGFVETLYFSCAAIEYRTQNVQA